MTPYDAVPAMVADLGLEEVHRAALALGRTGLLPVKLSDGDARVHPQRQRMTVAAVAVNQVVAILVK